MQTLVVEADSVADYLRRYYKSDRLADHDRAYGEGSFLARYEAEYAKHGYVCTSHHDNVTGCFIFWPFKPEEWATTNYRPDYRYTPTKG